MTYHSRRRKFINKKVYSIESEIHSLCCLPTLITHLRFWLIDLYRIMSYIQDNVSSWWEYYISQDKIIMKDGFFLNKQNQTTKP